MYKKNIYKATGCGPLKIKMNPALKKILFGRVREEQEV